MSDNPNTACEHGHQRRKCPHCEIADLERQMTAIIAAAQECFAVDDCGLIFWGEGDCDAPADKLQAALEAVGAKFRRMKA